MFRTWWSRCQGSVDGCQLYEAGDFTTDNGESGPRTANLFGLGFGSRRGSRVGRGSTFCRSGGGGASGLFAALLLLLRLLRAAFAGDEFLLGLGELERFALEVL